MEYDKYYKIDFDGLYTLHFINKDRLDVAEIRNIFSSYGYLMQLKVTKSDIGLVFIKYKTLQEVIRCWKGLRDSGKIQLLPEKSKMNKRINMTDSSQQQVAQTRTGNSFQKTVNNDKQLNSNFFHDKNLPNIGENSTPMRVFNENNGPKNFSNTTHQNSTSKSNQNVRGSESDATIFDEKSSLMSRQQTPMEINSSNTAIDDEKYYRLSKDGTYTVHFVNKKGLSHEQINELFASYGNVLSIHSRGDNNGLKFVRYKTVVEVTCCIKSLRNSNRVSLLPQKDKMAEIKTDKKRSSSLQSLTEDTSQVTTNSFKYFNSNSTHNERSQENEEKSFHSTKIFDLDKLKDNDYSDTASCSSVQSSSRQNKFNGNEIKYDTNPQMVDKKCSFNRQAFVSDNYNQIREKQQEIELYPSIRTETTNTKMIRNMRVNTDDYEVPALISDIETKSSESDIVSYSLLSNGTKPKIVVFPMQEIIVANIHTKYGVHYILHLFEKYDPISATIVKTISEKNIRYCHVYFKTEQDAVAVEKEFDSFDLAGKSLIVLRRSRLIDEVVCK